MGDKLNSSQATTNQPFQGFRSNFVISTQDESSSIKDRIKRCLVKKWFKIFSISVSSFVLVILVYSLFATFNQVKGEPIEPFKRNEIVLSEKITYLFRLPTPGDRVIFEVEDTSADFVGIIIDVNTDNGSIEYVIQSSPGKPWGVLRDRIKRRIYYPFVSEAQIQSILTTLTPTPTGAPEASPSPEPTGFPTEVELPPKFNLTPTPTPTPTIPPLRSIFISGFAYEDTNDDGFFNSADSKLPYMQFYLYDSYNPEKQISTIYSDTNGNFSITLNVRRKLIVRPTTYNNFRPRGGQLEFSTSTQNIEFGFRSVGAPVPGQVGKIEGDVFQDSNRNGLRDNGEQGIYFYKLYLVDNYGSYYNTDQNTQTTDPGGHFRFVNLPIGRTFTLRLSNPTGDYIIDRAETTMTLTSTQTEFTNVQIPVFKTN